MADQQKTCFVVMGFGVKTDYHNSRELDLNKSYKHIIKPAVEAAGLKCIRADEIPHAGTIDVPMFEQLLNADLVLADLSSSNLNAAYELGVRHALKPRTTIIIAEDKFANPFDISHIVIRRYKHDGLVLDIDVVESFRTELTQAIRDIMASEQKDSPVYTFLPDLEPPEVRVEAVDTIGMPKAFHSLLGSSAIELPMADIRPETPAAPQPAPSGPALADLLKQVSDCKQKKDFLQAKGILKTMHEMAPRQSQWVQQLALVTYKSEYPDKLSALHEAIKILETLQPITSNNAETLGLWGAVHKRLFDATRDQTYLDQAINAYEKGYRLQNDYYNGINWAYLLNVRASQATDKASAITDFMLARRTREDVLKIADVKFTELKTIKDVENDDDRYWVLATKAEALVGLDDEAGARQCLLQAANYGKPWMLESTQTQLANLRSLLIHSPLTGL